ncbi:MAG TPA: exopolysaccharide biosynthesis protein [Erysipelotrichaceae bacterium]|nr:exopolysaccharide biosynthesis protein [Erysipelotrichaceae bacterium]
MKRRFLYIRDTVIILAFTIYALLDFFVIPKTYGTAQAQTVPEAAASALTAEAGTETETAEAEITGTSYQDENISVIMKTYQVNDTIVYVADVQLSSIEYLKTAFAENVYGRNVTETTSEIAEGVNAILAINGDYYGARDSGYVLRNGTLYRTNTSGKGQEDLVILSDGSFEIINESETSAEELNELDALQVFAFGPALLTDGEISVTISEEVSQAKSSNPRTAIAEIEPLHYLFVVADGRTDESEGLTLYELADFLQHLGADTAYNLDGGGSSTMVFNGNLINNPTSTGKIKERSVSDIVYIGY